MSVACGNCCKCILWHEDVRIPGAQKIRFLLIHDRMPHQHKQKFFQIATLKMFGVLVEAGIFGEHTGQQRAQIFLVYRRTLPMKECSCSPCPDMEVRLSADRSDKCRYSSLK